MKKSNLSLIVATLIILLISIGSVCAISDNEVISDNGINYADDLNADDPNLSDDSNLIWMMRQMRMIMI